MFQKTFSQKVARIFEIVGYVMLLPAVISLIYPLMALVASIADFRPEVVLFGSIPLILFGLGVVLLVGYIKHSRGSLDERKIVPLWGGTFFFNCLFLIPAVYSILTLTDRSGIKYQELSNPFALIGLFVFFWWLCAVFLSAVAAISEIRNQKYL